MNFFSPRIKNLLAVGALLAGAAMLLGAVFAGSFGHHSWGPLRLGLLAAGGVVFLPGLIFLTYQKKTTIVKATWNGLRRHLWLIALYGLIVIIFLWFVTNGTWKVFTVVQRGYGQYYDYQAESILKGRLDVPLEAIDGEQFTVNGRYYGYQGIGPALLRIPLNYFFPALWGKWSRFMLLMGCLINVFITARFLFLLVTRLSEGQKKPSSTAHTIGQVIFITAAGLGSTNLFLSIHASLYHEAISTGASLALLAYFGLYCYIEQGKKSGWLVLALVSAFFSFNSRSSSGVGPLLTMALLLVPGILQFIPVLRTKLMQPWLEAFILSRRHLAAVSGLLLGITLLQFWVNYTRFGSPFEMAPFQNQVAFLRDPTRMARVQGNKFHLTNLAYATSIYILPASARQDASFPSLLLTYPSQTLQKAALIDHIEPVDAAGITSTVFLLLALTGFIMAIKYRRQAPHNTMLILLTAGTVATCIGTLSFTTYSERYFHDFYPCLAIFGALGAAFLLVKTGGIKRVFRVCLASVLLLLVLFNAWEMFAFSYRVQMDVWLAPPVRRAELHALSNNVNATLGLPPITNNLITIYKKLGEQ